MYFGIHQYFKSSDLFIGCNTTLCNNLIKCNKFSPHYVITTAHPQSGNVLAFQHLRSIWRHGSGQIRLVTTSNKTSVCKNTSICADLVQWKVNRHLQTRCNRAMCKSPAMSAPRTLSPTVPFPPGLSWTNLITTLSTVAVCLCHHQYSFWYHVLFISCLPVVM